MMRAAIIGTGFIGSAHATAYKNLTKTTLVAICDLSEEKGKKAAEDFSCKYYKDAEDMLRSEEIDIVDICLPTFLHEQYVLLAAKYKKHIICEKPITLTKQSMDKMTSAVKQAGVYFMVAQVLRFWPEYMEIKKMYDAGEFGDIKMVYANRIAQHPNWTQWHKDPAKSGGGLFDLHLHDIDYLQHLFGDIESVYATGKQSDTGCWNFVMSTLKFKNGCVATAEGIFDMTENYPFTMSFRIVGENKTVEYKFSAGFNLENVAGAQRSAIEYENDKQPHKLEIAETDAYQNEIEYFINKIQANEPLETITADDSVHVLDVILALQKSLETGEIVKL